MITEVLFLGGAIVVGAICLGLVTCALLYLGYCLLAPHLEKRGA